MVNIWQHHRVTVVHHLPVRTVHIADIETVAEHAPRLVKHLFPLFAVVDSHGKIVGFDLFRSTGIVDISNFAARKKSLLCRGEVAYNIVKLSVSALHCCKVESLVLAIVRVVELAIVHAIERVTTILFEEYSRALFYSCKINFYNILLFLFLTLLLCILLFLGNILVHGKLIGLELIGQGSILFQRKDEHIVTCREACVPLYR